MTRLPDRTSDHDQGRVEVLVVGAGPTGLVLGCELARRKVRVRIIDQAATPARGSRGKGLQPRTLEAFDDITAVRAAATGYPPMCHYQPDGTTVAAIVRMFPLGVRTPNVPYPNTLLVPQWQTEQILRGRLAALGVTVETGTRLTGWQHTGTTVTATLTSPSGEQTVRAGYLVGADGAHSTVRRLLGLDFGGTTNEHDHSLLADLTAPLGLDRELQHLWVDPADRAEQVWLCPLPHNAHTWQLILRSRQPLPETWTLETLQQLVTQRTRRADLGLELLDWYTVYRGASARTVTQWRAGRVLLAGDAAHIVPPEGGQGLNLGVGDAGNLGWKLAAVLTGAPSSLLDTYQDERLPATHAALELSRGLHAQATQGGPGAYRRPPATSQLQGSYATGLLAVDLRAQPGTVTAGDRAPDAPCHQPATHTDLRLFDLYRGPQWTLLAVSTPAAAAATAAVVEGVNQHYGAAVAAWTVTDPDTVMDPDTPAAGVGAHTLIDTHGHIRAGYGLTNSGDTLLLIRPDGYLGWVGPPDAAGQLASYLTRVTGIPNPSGT